MTGYKECDKNVQGVHRSLTNRVLSPSNQGLNLCRENSSKLGALIWHIKYHQKVWGNVCWKQNRDVLMKCWWCLAVDRYQNIDPDLTCYHRCGSSGETITKDNRLLTGEIEFRLVSDITRIMFKSTPAIVVKQGTVKSNNLVYTELLIVNKRFEVYVSRDWGVPKHGQVNHHRRGS